jgi:hypothetical protein
MIEGTNHSKTQVTSDNLKRDELVTVQLFRKDAEPIKFGIVFSDHKKKSLWSANEFFHDIQANGTNYEKSIFPDLISCIEDRSMIYSFGLFDSYGLMYALSPTLYQYRVSQLGRPEYSFLDLIHIFIDVFKASRILIAKGYFLKDFDERDIGITRVVNGANATVKGKIRQLHNIRKAHVSCNPQHFVVYKTMLSSYNRRNQRENWTRNIALENYESCQIINLHLIFKLLVEKLTVSFFHATGNTLMFDECIFGTADPSECPEELNTLWQSDHYKETLSKFLFAGLRYKPLSSADFLINLLEAIKTDFLEKKVKAQLDILTSKVTHRREFLHEIKTEEKQIQSMDQKIADLVPLDKKTQLDQILEEKRKEVQVNLDQGKVKNQDIHAMNIFRIDPMMDLHVEEMVIDLIPEQKKKEAMELHDQKENVLQKEMDQIFKEEKQLNAQKKKIKDEIKLIKMQSMEEAEEIFKKQMKNQNELKLIEMVKQSDGKTSIEILQENPSLAAKVRQEWEKKGIKFKPLDPETIKKIEQENGSSVDKENIGSSVDKSEHTDSSGNSEEFDEDNISEMLSQESLDLIGLEDDEELLGRKISDDFAREDLDLDGLTLDLDEEEGDQANVELLNQLHQETLEDGAIEKIKKNFDFDVSTETLQKTKDEDQMLLNYQKAGKIDEAMAIQHALKNKLMNEYSLSAELNSEHKLIEVDKLLKRKKQLIELKNSNVDGRNDRKIKDIEIEIEAKIAGMYSGFGKLENIGIMDSSVKTITLLELGEENSIDELENLHGVSFLEELDEINMRLLI